MLVWYFLLLLIHHLTFNKILIESKQNIQKLKQKIKKKDEEEIKRQNLISEKINETDGNKLIQKGVRGNNATNLGSGIGLAFAYELLENMGAELSIELMQKNDKETLFVSSIKLEGVVSIYK